MRGWRSVLSVSYHVVLQGQRWWPSNFTSVLISAGASAKNCLLSYFRLKAAHLGQYSNSFLCSTRMLLWWLRPLRPCLNSCALSAGVWPLVRLASLEGGQAVTDRFSGWWRGECSREQKKNTASIGSQRLLPSYWSEAVSPCTLCPHERSGASLMSQCPSGSTPVATKSLWELHNFKGHHT